MPERASLSGEDRDSRPAPDRQEKAMFTHPDRIGQLAREHHHQMLAQASGSCGTSCTATRQPAPGSSAAWPA
jgi:hypothetical protein